MGGPVRRLLSVVTLGWIVGALTGRRMGVLVVKEGPAHFEPLAELCVAGDIRIYIDRTFELAGVAEASPTWVKTGRSGRSSSRFTDPVRPRAGDASRLGGYPRRRVEAGG
jgi:hypothetical protein